MLENKKAQAKILIQELLSVQASQEREDTILSELEKLLPDPEFMNYIYWSNEFENADGSLDLDGLIKKCLAHRAIILP